MSLLPTAFQDKTQYLPLGKAVQKPEPVKADPNREFEKHNHDIPGAAKHHVTPELAARALRSLCAEDVGEPKTMMRDMRPLDVRQEALDRIFDASINRQYDQPWGDLKSLKPKADAEPLTWPLLPGLPEPTFLPEVVNPT